MKKINFLAVCFLVNLSYGQLVDFESHPLAVESFDNGASGNGDFIFDNLTFSNSYDATWGSWNGFSISNVTDNSTAGFGNQYGSFTGGGNTSTNFAVFYPNGTISVNGGGVIESFYISNTSYSAIAMRDGDSFSKQFGSPNDASGTPDGTNGEDYFRVWVIVENDTQTAKDSLEFYLADYRFADPNDDYIVNGWEFIDLTSLNVAASSISFRFESSDVGQWGINTPQYFAIDDVKYAMPLGVELIEFDLFVYPNPVVDVFNVAAPGISGELTLTDLSGNVIDTMIFNNTYSFDAMQLAKGAYIVQLIDSDGNIARSTFIK